MCIVASEPNGFGSAIERVPDSHLWQKYRDHCGVRRFWNGEDEEIGRLVHKPGDAEHARWVFDYDPGTTDDYEARYRFGMHAFAPLSEVRLCCRRARRRGDDPSVGGQPQTLVMWV
jgi:hypothetical protein